MDDEQEAYEVVQEDAGFRVRDETGMSIMTCRDRGSAEHYASLLNRAYRKGYKAGYRAARGRRGD